MAQPPLLLQKPFMDRHDRVQHHDRKRQGRQEGREAHGEQDTSADLGDTGNYRDRQRSSVPEAPGEAAGSRRAKAAEPTEDASAPRIRRA
jgi:hypothetical protein